MDNNFDDNLSDVTIDINVDTLNDICVRWDTSIVQIDIGSLDVKQEFMPLTSCNVAVSYIPSLDTSLNNLTNLMSSMSKIIANAVEEHVVVDEGGFDGYYGSTTSNSFNVSSNYRNLKGIGSNGVATQLNDTVSNNFNSVNTFIDNSSYEVKVNTDFVNMVNSLDFNSYNELMTTICSMATSKISVINYLNDSKYAYFLKEKLLSINNLENGVKKCILEMDPKDLQKTLYSIVNDSTVLDSVSKDILYTYTKNIADTQNNDISIVIKNKESVVKIFTEFNDYSKTFNKLLNDKEKFNKNLIDIYDGNTNEFSNKEVSLVRSVINNVASKQNTNSEELIFRNDADNLRQSFESIAKSFKYISSIGYTDLNTATSILGKLLS